MNNFLTYILSFFEYNGKTSSKRAIGIISSIALIVYMFIWPSSTANDSVLILALGIMGVTGLEKFNKNKEEENK